MEKEQEGLRQIDWPMVVEYFTKRGRPQTAGELLKLKREDQIEKEKLEAE